MKKRIFSCLMALLLLLTLPLTASCGRPRAHTVTSFDYFDTVTTVIGYETREPDFAQVSAEILSELEEYHRLFDIHQHYEGINNLAAVNDLQNGVHPTVEVDRRIIDLLLYAREVYTLTEGKVNIAMGSVLSLWHDCREAGLRDPKAAALPPMDALVEAAAHTSIEDILIDEARSTVTLADPAMRLDVGAIAKGYAVEMVARALEARGVTGYLLNVGGTVRAIGAKTEGEPWLAGIEHPDKDAQTPYLHTLHLTREALVTSGAYLRTYTVDGTDYHHIIDPDTLMPAQGYLSVSVVCTDAAAGDALSTALFCMSPEQGLALISSLPDTEAMWVITDGTRQYSDGFAVYVAQ